MEMPRTGPAERAARPPVGPTTSRRRPASPPTTGWAWWTPGGPVPSRPPGRGVISEWWSGLTGQVDGTALSVNPAGPAPLVVSADEVLGALDGAHGTTVAEAASPTPTPTPTPTSPITTNGRTP